VEAVGKRRIALMIATVVAATVAPLLASSQPARAASVNQQISAGFGDAGNTVASAMAVYRGRIYAGTDNGAGCQVWSSSGSGWTQVVGQGAAGTSTGPGFGIPQNIEVSSETVFGDYLYAGTMNSASGCRIWRFDGSGWTQVVGQGAGGTPTGPGFGSVANSAARSMAVLGNYLYVGTDNNNGCQVWRSPDGTTWTPVVGAAAAMPAGFGNANNLVARSMAAYGSNLYVGTYKVGVNGADVWRTDGSSWTAVAGPGGVIGAGFGDGNNSMVLSMAVYDSALYMGTANASAGCEVWRYNGSACSQMVGQGAAGTSTGPGFGNPSNIEVYSMVVYDSHLYAGTKNILSGCYGWRFDGSGWSEVVGQDPALTWGTGPGFGNPDNAIAYVMQVFDSRLYMGTQNTNGGCEVWCTKSATTWYLAEGATAGGFETWILVQNPNSVSVGVTIKFQTGAGEVAGPADVIPANSRRSYPANTYVSSFDVSTKVISNGPDIICERSVYWTAPAHTSKVLGHDSIGVIQPAMKWYLAEGATRGGYETWVLVQNPNSSAVDVDLKFQTQSGQIQGPAESIPARSRKSYSVDPWVDTFDVSTLVTSLTPGEPVICERAVYYTPEGATHKEVGTDSIGVTETSSVWYLAEGATDGGFETFILVQNPNNSDVAVNIKFQTTSGEVQGPVDTVPARSRKTYRANDRVKDFNVSTKVESTGGDVVCERSMYWTASTRNAKKTIGHDCIGVKLPGYEWYMAEGATRGGYETWVLVQNPNDAQVTVRLQFQTGAGLIPAPGSPEIKDNIPAGSRRSYKVNAWVDSYDVSTKVSVTSGGPVICERAVYLTPTGSAVRALGTDSIGFTLY
jgi:hypothetical protein